MMELNTLQWEQLLINYPNAHLLQSSKWGKLKSIYGWEPIWIGDENGGAQILFRKIPLGLTIAYIPKGPVGKPDRQFWQQVDGICKKKKAIFLKLEPDLWDAEENCFQSSPGWIPSEPIQPRRTLVVSLEGGEQDWLNRMMQKTRYNVRLAVKKDVQVIESDDVDAFYQLMNMTGMRDGFGVHTREYYENIYKLFIPTQQCALLAATFDQKWLAALMAFRQGDRAWYFYGASSNEERNRMPAYILQFEAMRWAARYGCTTYDLWGVPDEDQEKLEASFTERKDGLWGVYRFKRGFGGRLMRSAGSWDKVYQPGLYRLFQLYLRLRRSSDAHSQ